MKLIIHIPFLEKFIHFISKFPKSISVARAICLSFGFAIFTGSIAIYISEQGKLHYIDSFYLSASAFCVTGLSPLPISSLNFFSQFLIMIFIQMGGLGIILFTVLIGLMVIKNLSRNSNLEEFVKEVLDADLGNQKTSGKVLRMIVSIFNITITIEMIGAMFLFFTMPEDLPNNSSRFFLSIFTSISAFNNAGFSIVDDLGFLKKSPIPLYGIVTLIILGGIGYPVIIFVEKSLLEILRNILTRLEIWGETIVMRKAIKGEDPPEIFFFITKLSIWADKRIETYNETLFGESNKVQTFLVFYGTLILLFGGTILFFFLEKNNPDTLLHLSFHEKFANSLFVSASSRTAGFNTFQISKVYDASIALLCVLMFIGGGPQGTAGGIKITTFSILMKYLGNVIHSTSKVEIFGHLISKRSVAMSIRLYFLGTSLLAFIIFILALIHEQPRALKEITFEVISAFSTVGFSLDFTSTNLSVLEKFIYSLTMFVGRIGVFTVLIAFTGNPVTSQIGGEDNDIKIQVG
jgi:trk system potassium uptake protein TrkH